ncbi:MAG: gliding motility-associated C-terminal domain-containing protein, partial [Flavobacteriales bacterium]|nr:gliding motility-associated C-terminal domain-containing protein [Flavobacteriales bacterium]
IFVAKFSSDGTTLLYSTYLPGNSSEFGTSIAVDALGRAYITGVVDLNFTGQTNFPSTPNAYQPVHADGPDAILTVLDPTGSSLVYATFLGGDGGESGYGVALGPTGIAYVTGTTSYIGYPEVAATNYPQGDKDVFVAKFDIAQSGAASLIYSVRIGGGPFSQCTAHGIAVDDAGNAYVTGSTGFGNGTFPVTPGAYNTVYSTGVDGTAVYLLKLGTTLPVALVYSTFLGPGMGTSVAVHTTTGEAFVSGNTYTPQFPTTPGALQTVHGGATDAFALRMNAAGSALIYSTFLGGPGYDQSTDIVSNGVNEAYVAGIARDGFPTSPGALQPALAGGLSQDMWVVQLNSTGTAYGCGGSTYFGGTSDEYYGSFYDYLAPSLALHDSGGQDTLSIAATTHSQDFPTTPGVYEPLKVNGIADQPVFFKFTCASMPMAPVAGFNADVLPTCTGALVDFDDTSINGADTWTWSFPGGAPTSSTAQNPQDISYPAAGNYTVTLIACNAIGCDTVVQQITVALAPPATVDLGNDTTLCDGGTATLNADPGFATYIWEWNGSLLSDGTSSITVSEPGVYTVSVADSAGCSGVDTVEVDVLNTPTADFSYAVEETPCASPRLNFIGAAGGTSYLWAFGDSTSATGPQQQHTYALSGTYTVMLTVSDGPCTNTATQTVFVPEASALAMGPAVVPNVFSPNGDGVNDCFAPVGLEDFANCYSLVVFDRWGVAVFRSGSPNACWKGVNDAGDALPDGVYYYLLTLGDVEYPGAVEVLR